ncbi:hypothetical protein [Pseudomonas schmalbachii]|uniref:Uncharacterized protein n=1 Tax=Pseudomonas schmalbachii TaxID=2816993 RepID=A0ABS3TVF9_9PSED|nr:hypothetical protein [Pseudomonas schmalbachii]MBO3276554.1 hypothetical protein [Pseudomonas schmalbachii]
MRKILRIFMHLLGLAAISTVAIEPSEVKAMSGIDEQVSKKAALAVAQLNERAKGKLDYSEASIQVIEELASEAAQYSSQLDSSTIESLTQLLGSYILEVAHRQYGGSYLWYEPQNAPLLAVGEPKFSVAIVPFEKVRGRISGDSADNLVFFYQGFSERVRSAKGDTVSLYK